MDGLALACRWLVLIELLTWFVFYWQGGCKALLDIQAAYRAKSYLDMGLMLVIGAFTLAAAGGALWLTLSGWAAGGWWTAVGTLGVMGGITGMFYCRQILGSFWTAETTLKPEHQLVARGPYARVRHPIYSFAILMVLGLGLAFWHGWLLAAVLGITAAYVLKTWEEDRFLQQNLPGYADYCARVRFRLLPGVW